MLVFTNLNATFSFLFYFRFKITRSPLRLYSVYEEYKSRAAALKQLKLHIMWGTVMYWQNWPNEVTVPEWVVKSRGTETSSSGPTSTRVCACSPETWNVCSFWQYLVHKELDVKWSSVTHLNPKWFITNKLTLEPTFTPQAKVPNSDFQLRFLFLRNN